MKKSILKTLVFTLFLFSTEKVISQNSEIEFSDLKTTDEIFKIKNTVTENNSIDFLKHFYVVSLAENISKNEELTSALTYALGNIIKSELNFSCIALNSKKVFNFLKKSKSKNEIIEEIEKNNFENFTFFEFEGEIEEGTRDFELIKLTNEVYALNVRSCGSGGGYHDQFILISDSESEPNFTIEEDFINGIMFTAEHKLEKLLKTTLSRQYAKAQNYGTTKINGEDYITLPYYQGDENPGGFYYVLIIAYNFKSNSFYYIYDNPNSENDNWKRDRNDLDFQFYTWVTEKNPDWKQLN